MNNILRHPALRRMQLHRDLALIVLVVAGCALPFLSQPFHMDDNFYMDMARGVRQNPLFPYDMPYDFGGLHLKDMASHSHPPMQAYFLAVVHSLAGEGDGREWVYHLAATTFPILAAVSLYFLAALFVERPLWPALLLAVCPLFLVMGHTLMTDVPGLAFWLAAIACFLWGTEMNRRGLLAASSIFQFAAMFTAYQSVALTPLLAFYQIRKRGRMSGWVSLILPLVGMAAWLEMNYVHYGRLVIVDTLGYVESRHAEAFDVIGAKALALLEYQGWLIVFPLFILYKFARGLRGRLLGLSLTASVIVAQAAVPGYRLVDKAIFVVGLTTGIFVCAHMGTLIREAFGRIKVEVPCFGRTEAQFLVLWYFGVAAYCLFLFTEGSARYILPLVPPFLIYFFRRLEMSETSEYRVDSYPVLNSAMVASGSLVLSLAWGLFLAQADFEFARVYPRAAASFSRMSAGLDSYVMGEWGFRYYFGRIGAKPLPADESVVRGGSCVIRPKLALPYDMPPDLFSMSMPLASVSYDVKTPFRTMDPSTPAGFYSTGWGLIPFSLSRESLEILEIRQISFLVERLPWARVETASGIAPWPGYVRQGVLAMIAMPETNLVYPWDARIAMSLSLKIGILPDAPASGEDTFEFEILYRDGSGKDIARYDKVLAPGARKEDGDWQPVRLVLPASGAGGETLAFRYSVRGASRAAGAFAEAFIVPE